MTGTLLIVAGLAVLAGLFWLANGVRQIGAVSSGVPIGQRSGTALLLIDLQAVFWDEGPYAGAAKADAKAAILAEVSAARAEAMPVIALRQEWSIPSTRLIARLLMKGQALSGTPGTALAAPFAGLADHVLVKRVQDSFETGELDALLEKLDIGRLRIVGLDMNYCVAKTALAARLRGYAVEIVTAATLAANPAATARTCAALAEHGVALR
ncbi:isochorismatase family protein [Peteryoungia desertarenae]|uniref:Isochorismatase family protein n=1 Tax=Peteryoungia desertarenae TaxID=1813451 RepID=A0ABX6QMM0_9HYPH|nr:isochorismatase family protein [Peteryoungia desertarenae]QLF69851.1 isochorismatase family protein [Peteryoungia desertarenae]